MYCRFCGAENADDQRFCSECGRALNSLPVQTDIAHSGGDSTPPIPPTVPPETPSQSTTDFCPYCHASSESCAPIGKTEVKKSGTGGFLSRCLGVLLLGPAGLLCGFCGDSIKVKNETWWVCKNCGREFISKESAIANAISEIHMATVYTLLLAAGIGNCWGSNDIYNIGFICLLIIGALWVGILQSMKETSGRKITELLTQDELKIMIIRYIGFFLFSAIIGFRWGISSQTI